VKSSKQDDRSRRQRQGADGLPRGEAFSYYSARNQTSEDTPIQRRSLTTDPTKPVEQPNQWWNHLPTILFTLVVLFCLGYEILLSSNPKIVIHKDSSSNYLLRPPAVYENAAGKLFSKSFSNQNKLTINTGYIASKLEIQFPELTSVSVTLPVLGHQPSVYLYPATPALILGTQSEGNFLIDGSGKVLTNVQRVKIPKSDSYYTVTEQTALKVRVGEFVVSNSDINFIQFVIAQMKASGLSIKSMILPAESREMDVYFNNAPYYVKFNLDASGTVKQQVGAFLATRQYIVNSHVTVPTQYIDVRAPGRVYYQ
jgi:hypothetical protein